jgi:hypothetical protein
VCDYDDLIFPVQIWRVNTMTNTGHNRPVASRRNFLQKTMLLLSGSAVASQSNATQDAPSTTKLNLTAKQSSSSGYHETEHIRNYYKSAGL